MLWTLLMVLVGVLIGWHFPQPEWAKPYVAKVVALPVWAWNKFWTWIHT